MVVRASSSLGIHGPPAWSPQCGHSCPRAWKHWLQMHTWLAHDRLLAERGVCHLGGPVSPTSGCQPHVSPTPT